MKKAREERERIRQFKERGIQLKPETPEVETAPHDTEDAYQEEDTKHDTGATHGDQITNIDLNH